MRRIEIIDGGVAVGQDGAWRVSDWANPNTGNSGRESVPWVPAHHSVVRESAKLQVAEANQEVSVFALR